MSLTNRVRGPYLINQARGPYWENIGSRSWQYGPSAARSVQKRPRADILPVRSRASKVNKRFITRLKKIFIKRRGQRKGLKINGILIEHLKRVLVKKNNIQMLFNRELKSIREFLFKQSLLFLFCKPLQRTDRKYWTGNGAILLLILVIGPPAV